LASAAIVGLRAVGDYTETTGQEGKSTPTIVSSHDYGLDRLLSLGVYGSFSTTTTPEFIWSIPKITNPFDPSEELYEGGTGTYQYRVLTYSVGGRGLYHLYSSETIDFYT
jgi:hypothetical protein